MANFNALIKSSRGRRVAAGVVGVAALGGAGAVAAAAVGSDGEIRGCYDKHGRLRVLASEGDSCERNEQPISWNHEGPVGPEGPLGPIGPQGETGPAGEDGRDGRDGLQGAQGIPGPQGPEGPRGPEGPAGASSCDGPGGDPQAAGFDAFIKIDGIDGESSDDKHKGEIDVISFSWGVTATIDDRIGLPTAGKPDFDEITITKKTDLASAPLILATATGEHIKEAVLTIRKPASDGKPLEYLKIKMTDILISAVNQAGGDSSDRPTESISFNYSKILFTYQNEDGDSSEAEYDIKKNTKL